MTKYFKGGTYLLAGALALALLFSGGIAKADGFCDGHHDNDQWSTDKDNGYTSDFQGNKDNGDSNGWVDDDHGNGDCDGGGGKQKDPGGVPEPSSLALLSFGMFGVMAFVRRQNRGLATPNTI